MSATKFYPDSALVAAMEAALLVRNGRERGDEIISTCVEPARHQNGDEHPSLRYNRKKFAWNCKACGAKGSFLTLANALGIELPKRARAKSNAKREGLTLAQYVEFKRLDPQLLIAEGVADAAYQKGPAVWIPAPLPDGTTDGAGQFRVKVKGPDHLMSAADKKARPLGLHRLQFARERGYLVCVEGPSCQQTLAQHGEPALGFPGADISKDILAQLAGWLEGIPRVVVVREPGPGGSTFLERLASVVPERIHVVDPAPFKDTSDMHVADPTAFAERWAAAVAAALPLEEAARRDARSGAELLTEVVAFLRRFVVMSAPQLDACALWTMHTHAFDAAEATPYLQAGSAEKRSGKTRLLEVLEQLVRRPWLTGRVTAAVLVRKIDAEGPTLLLDESDAAFKSGDDYAEALRGILNSGHRRGGKASLCVGQGANITYRDFSTFGPKAIAGIGKLPDTVSDRSIRIELKRRASGEEVERFRLRSLRPQTDPLRQRLEQWATANVEALKVAAPVIPPELDDRAADGWEPLFAIADRAGDPWPERARMAARELSAGDDRQDDSIAVQLLRDVQRVFTEQGRPDHLATAALTEALAADPESPWADWGKRHGMITPRALAGLLRRFGVTSRSVRLGQQTPKGYSREQFEDAWRRYLVPTPISADPSATAPQPNENGHQTDLSLRHTDGPVADAERGSDPMFIGPVALWRMEAPETGVQTDQHAIVEKVF